MGGIGNMDGAGGEMHMVVHMGGNGVRYVWGGG